MRENFKAEFVSFELKEAKKGRNIIHWLPKSQALKCRVLGVERDYEGLVEDNVVKEVDKVVQFERFAFCRIEKASEESVLAIYTHP